LRNTDKYSAVFTEYSVAEYSAGHYSAEYSADRIVGRSLAVTGGGGRGDGFFLSSRGSNAGGRQKKQGSVIFGQHFNLQVKGHG
jgi:hypothetical protein